MENGKHILPFFELYTIKPNFLENSANRNQ